MTIKIPAFVLLLTVVFCSCKVTEQNVTGVYRLKIPSKTKLVLNKDKTFEFVKNFSEPGPVFFPDSTEMNFRTTGRWMLDANKKIVLNSFPPEPTAQPTEYDSVIPNTSITSFSFWNHDGDPVSIRFMKLPPAKIKLYKANSISFFAGDFSKTDTLEFYFYGYHPVKWPGKFRQMADNFSHRITLYEESRPGYFSNVSFSSKRKKLISSDKTVALYKR